MMTQNKPRMQTRLQWILPVAALLILAGLATGSPVFLTVAAMLLLLTQMGLISVLWVSKTLRFETGMTAQSVRRGADVQLRLTVRHGCILPIAPITLTLTAMPEMPAGELILQEAKGRSQTMMLPFHASHVGVSSPGIQLVTVSDLFGLFTRSWMPETTAGELLVLPVPFEVSPLRFAPGDAGLGTMARASEDVTSPSDVRGYQQGDPMKKIHWKLSQRKNELMVRKFEEPIMSEALILMDCAEPPHRETQDEEADIRDTLLETAAALLSSPAEREHRLHLPLSGSHPVELTNSMAESQRMEYLARVDFSAPDRFERVLQLEMRRMRQVGAVVVISAHIHGRIVEVMTAMHRMGPEVRLYLATVDPEDPQILPFVSRLQQAGCEVCYVTPERL